MIKRIALKIVDLYIKNKHLFISGYCCRYSPSCSQYARQAIQLHGVFYGVFLAFKRLLSCNQFFPGGYDPAPGSGR